MKKFKVVIFCLLLAEIAQAKNLTQLELNQTSRQNFESADSKLNKAYKKLMSVLEKDRKKELKKVQLAWLKFRDLNAEFNSNQYKGGSMASMIYSQKLKEMTEKRTAELIEMYLELSTL